MGVGGGGVVNIGGNNNQAKPGGNEPTRGANVNPPQQTPHGTHRGGGNEGSHSDSVNNPNRGTGHPERAPLIPPGQLKKLAQVEANKAQEQQTRQQLTNQLDAARNLRVNDSSMPDNQTLLRQQNSLPDAARIIQDRSVLPDTHRLGEQSSTHQPPGHAYGWHNRFDHPASESNSGSSHLFFNHGHGNGRSDSVTSLGETISQLNRLTSAAGQFLQGQGGGEHLSEGLQRALVSARQVLGEEFAATLKLAGEGEAKSGRIIQHALSHLNHEFEKALEKAGQFPRGANDLPGVPKEFIRAAVEELAETARLERFFRQMEKQGGRVVTQTEERLAQLLYGERGGSNNRGERIYPAEVLRDLRAGAFLPAEESYNPFPLTGRARVVTEFMEMMRVLELIDRAEEAFTDLRGERAATIEGAPSAVAVEAETMEALLKALLGAHADGETLDQLLASLLPTLPSRAGRIEMLRLIAAFEGVLRDAHGQTLVGKDGLALKLDQLLWVGTLGGSVRASLNAERFPVHLSPLLIYGFDAIYSVIGFDGRTLNPPHFAAVQAHVNGSEMEWVFGQPPFTEGWLRALIERLKDSISTDDNLLGELLEVALADGCFHAVLMSGRVEDGAPVSDSFGVVKLLPGFSGDIAAASVAPA